MLVSVLFEHVLIIVLFWLNYMVVVKTITFYRVVIFSIFFKLAICESFLEEEGVYGGQCGFTFIGVVY